MEPKRYKDTKYLVYPDGRIFSEHKRSMGFINGEIKQGYRVIEIYNNGNIKRRFAHQMVAECFIYNPEHKPHINHKNGIKLDNRIENLEWCTPAENNAHAIAMGLIDNSVQRVFTDSQIQEMKQLASWGVKHLSIAKKFKSNPSTVSHILSYKVYKYLDVPENNHPTPEYVLNAYKNGEIDLSVALDIISKIIDGGVLKSLNLQSA